MNNAANPKTENVGMYHRGGAPLNSDNQLSNETDKLLLNRRSSSLSAKSNKSVGPSERLRTLGVPKPSRSRPTRAQSVSLLIFRTIGIIIILLSILWFILLYRIVSDFGSLKQSVEVMRPPVFNPHDVSRLEWLIKVRLERTVPLLDIDKMDSPVFIVTYERAEYLERALWNIFQYHPAHSVQNSGLRGTNNKTGRIIGSPIVISQDGDNTEVRAVIENYRNLFERKLGVPLYHIQHKQENITSDSYSWTDWEVPYKKLAIHYGWALGQVFSGAAYETKPRQHTRKMPSPPLPERVIILEEDIEVSRDFFSLMNATAHILDTDETLLAVSAYNDNGNENHVLDPKRLVRSDFFPGLGWMINRETWEGPTKHPEAALKGRWPNGFWDDWIREADVRRGRQILRPEISRSFHFGNVKGASDSNFAMKLSKIQLDEINVHWEEQDFTYLDPVVFAGQYWSQVSNAETVLTDADAKKMVAHKDVKLQYSDWKQFKNIAESLGIMQDEKAGVPRTAYEGIVEVRYGAGDHFIYLAPPYLNETSKPPDFGTKAWADFSKETLLQRLQIIDKSDDFVSW